MYIYIYIYVCVCVCVSSCRIDEALIAVTMLVFFGDSHHKIISNVM